MLLAQTDFNAFTSEIKTHLIFASGSAVARLFIFSCCISLCSACAHTQTAQQNQPQASWWPNANTFIQSAIDAASDSKTWAPLIAASLFAIDDLDQRTSDWASDKAPIFGRNNANHASDTLRDTLVYGTLLSAATQPRGEQDWWHHNGYTLLVQTAGIKLNSSITNEIKHATDRERPNQSSRLSFPSGHTSRAFAAANFFSRNLQDFQLSSDVRNWSNVAIYSFAAGTAWARVEAKAHYPSDVLAGTALGNFLSLFINNAFLPSDKGQLQMRFSVDYHIYMANLQWNWR